MIGLRLRTSAHPDTVAALAGKHPSQNDYDVTLNGPARILKPDGRPLCVYLPGYLTDVLAQHPQTYDVLHSLRSERTDNRGLASGSPRLKAPGQKRTRARLVPSAVVGAVDPGGLWRHCRLTAWTGAHVPQYQALAPFVQAMARAFQGNVPDRYANQMEHVRRTSPEWVIPGTPFTTLTVNNTYSTGVHQDAGDLQTGFSCLAVLRRGSYVGGRLCFPQWRVGVDMHDGDLILMDAHDWHGNTKLMCAHGLAELEAADCPTCAPERISVVAYYRERIAECGTAEVEHSKAVAHADHRSHIT